MVRPFGVGNLVNFMKPLQTVLPPKPFFRLVYVLFVYALGCVCVFRYAFHFIAKCYRFLYSINHKLNYEFPHFFLLETVANLEEIYIPKCIQVLDRLSTQFHQSIKKMLKIVVVWPVCTITKCVLQK